MPDSWEQWVTSGAWLATDGQNLPLMPGLMRDALALGLAAGNRNMGLMLAAAGAAVPELTWLYFAIAQLPIYLMPAMLKPLARRVAPPLPTSS